MLLKPILSKIATQGIWGSIILATMACTPSSIIVSPNTPNPVASTTPSTTETILQAATDAQQRAPQERAQIMLSATEQLLEKADTDWAHKLVARIDSNQLLDNDFIRYTLVSSELAIAREDFFEAQSLLSTQRLETLWQQQQIEIEDQQQLRQRRAELAAKLGDAETSIKERIILATLLLPGEESTDNQEAIWQNLMSLPKERLESLSQTTQASVLQGWYQLAFTNKSSQDDLEAQNSAVRQWVYTHPNHPASQQLPSDLQLLTQLIEEQPQQIALLLPLKGKLATAGRAIRDGFFAAYFEAYKKQQDTATIRVYDTSAYDINSLYDQAVSEGAKLVIGPLSKANVADLETRLQLPAPTLALNYLDKTSLGDIPNKTEPGDSTDNSEDNAITDLSAIEDSSTSTTPRLENLYQFGLSLEDEARQVAERAWLEGHRIALVIAPTSGWGTRSALAFMDTWKNLGGTVVKHSEFAKDAEYSKVIKSALSIDASEQRSRKLKRLFGQRFEFEPRRRKDIDMIFLVARPKEGRQIKPTLAFHYAGSVPVYSTSQIFASMRKDNKDSDLNGIRFTTLPWVFDGKIPAKKAIQDNLKVAGTYERLYAMGVDAFLLYPRLRQLQQRPGMKLYGATGELEMTTGNRIIRHQQWAEIQAGEAKPLPAIVTGYQADES